MIGGNRRIKNGESEKEEKQERRQQRASDGEEEREEDFEEEGRQEVCEEGPEESGQEGGKGQEGREDGEEIGRQGGGAEKGCQEARGEEACTDARAGSGARGIELGGLFALAFRIFMGRPLVRRRAPQLRLKLKRDGLTPCWVTSGEGPVTKLGSGQPPSRLGLSYEATYFGLGNGLA
ncbi:hypothetical protein [Bradyrhizobium sp.]|uniref:hypothetical protein n=1 Tax=Bradyrhizobium sp. TaxID=376 RepID=UPI0025C406DE|nr:hypothetical protein [Bradyrhizobium sp.]MBV8921182.1 hypothetical protein [Bradyrhizobium sp.]